MNVAVLSELITELLIMDYRNISIVPEKWEGIVHYRITSDYIGRGENVRCTALYDVHGCYVDEIPF